MTAVARTVIWDDSKLAWLIHVEQGRVMHPSVRAALDLQRHTLEEHLRMGLVKLLLPDKLRTAQQ